MPARWSSSIIMIVMIMMMIMMIMMMVRRERKIDSKVEFDDDDNVNGLESPLECLASFPKIFTLTAQVRKPAEAEKYRLEKIAEAERNRVVLEAEAEAEAQTLRGEAEAYAIGAP